MVRAGHWIWVDGVLTREDAAHSVPLLTHTLHYGVGAFEGIRAYQRADGATSIFRLGAHVERLFASCALVWMTPTVSRAQLEQGAIDVLAKNGLTEAYLRPISYLAAGSMGLLPDDNAVRTAIVAWPWGAYLGADGLSRGIRCKISSFTRSPAQSALTQGKLVGQYVNSVLAKREAKFAGYDEAILLDVHGSVAEGSGENLFIVSKGELWTPPISAGVLPGITRDTVMTLAREEGVTVREERFARDTLYLADEVFLTGTAAEVTPVREVDNHPIGNGAVGELTSHLQRRYFDVVKGADRSHPEWLTFVPNAEPDVE
jgi:branched-chain amino acid aminotransferase